MKNKMPKLRFKEFSDEWEETKIGKITSKVGSGKTPKGGSDVYTSEGVLFIRSQNVLNGTLKLEDAVYISEAENMKMKSSQIQEKDILLNITGASIGRSSVFNLKNTIANLNQHVCIIRSSLRIDSNFLQNQIVSSKIQNQIDSFQAGGNREGLNFQQVRDMKVIVPSLQEQEKIANFLSSVDTKIEMLEKKKELLSDYKKGMMQKLFSQKLRFKDENGNDYPEWEEKRFKELTYLITKQTGFDYSKTIKPSLITEKKDNNVPFIQNKDFSPTKINLDTDFYIPKIIQEKFPKITLDEKCLLITISGNIGNIGVFDKLEIAFIGGAVGIIKFNDKNIIDYIKHYLTCSEGQKMIKKEIKSSSHQNITIEGIREFKITLPSLQEQEKIANFLSSIDKKIELVEGELEKNKEFKKGLLQQMFV